MRSPARLDIGTATYDYRPGAIGVSAFGYGLGYSCALIMDRGLKKVMTLGHAPCASSRASTARPEPTADPPTALGR
jgi:hypothetical protein